MNKIQIIFLVLPFCDNMPQLVMKPVKQYLNNNAIMKYQYIYTDINLPNHCFI